MLKNKDNTKDKENVEYLDIPSKEEREKSWSDKLKSILPMVKQDIINYHKNNK